MQINHHPGWRALVNGKPMPLHRDGLGLMWMRPDCDGSCEVELVYDGGWELRLLRLLSGGTLAGLALGAAWLTFRWPKEAKRKPDNRF